MKVVILAPTPPPAGGIAGWTVRMRQACLKNGWKVKVVDEKLIGNRQVFGDNTRRNILNEIKRCLVIWINLWKALNDKEVKVVHSCIPAVTTGMMREYVCAIITKIRKKKFIIHYRCTVPYLIKTRLSKVLIFLLSTVSDLVIVLNIPSEDFIKRSCKTYVLKIPNFIGSGEVCTDKHISDEIHSVLYVGGVIEEKGCLDIINVAEKFPNIKFRLIGNPDKRIISMRNTHNVHLLGEQNKKIVRQELSKADLFMFVSYFEGEGFSNALVEAMAHGLPCLVSDWAANKDMIEENGGVVVAVKDIEAMIKAISDLIYNKDLREKQSRWNIIKVNNFYIDKVVTDMYVDAYEKIIEM